MIKISFFLSIFSLISFLTLSTLSQSIQYALSTSVRETLPCDHSNPCSLKFLLTQKFQDVPFQDAITIELIKSTGSDDDIFHFDDGVWIEGERSLILKPENNLNYDKIVIENLNFLTKNKSSTFSISDVNLSGNIGLKQFSSLSMTHVQPSRKNSLTLSISNIRDLTLHNITRDPLTREDFLKILITDVENSIELSQLSIENKEFETPLSITSTVDNLILSNIDILDSTFKNNQNGAIQISQNFRSKKLLIQNCLFISNQGAGANAMFSISDGALIDSILIQDSKISGNTGYFNGGGISIDYSSVTLEPKNSYNLDLQLLNSYFDKNSAGPQQKGGSLYIVQPPSTKFSFNVYIIDSTIQESSVDQGVGGGLYIEASSLNLIGNTLIQHNSASQGAGLHIASGVLNSDSIVWVRNNVADKYVGGVLFSKLDQSLNSKYDKERFNFNVVSSSYQQNSPNIGILEPKTIRLTTATPLSIQPFYPYEKEGNPPNVVGFFVDTFGNAITLQSQLDEEYVKSLYNDLQLVSSDPSKMQFFEDPEMNISPSGFEYNLQIIGLIGESTSIQFTSNKTSIKFDYEIFVDSCSEGHVATTVGSKAKQPSQVNLKYCAFGDKPIVDDPSNGRNLPFIARAIAVTVIVLLAFLMLLSLFIVGFFIRKKEPILGLSDSRIEDYTRFGIEDDSMVDD